MCMQTATDMRQLWLVSAQCLQTTRCSIAEAKKYTEQFQIEHLLKKNPYELSGGEKQRIGIARAFLHDSPLILMDEPTSNLDSLNEGIILKSLREASEKKTVVLVSHRKSTMNIADTVFEMKDGRIS